MRNNYDGGIFENYNHFVDVALKVIGKVVETTGSKLEIGILCSTENAIKLTNEFIRNGVDLVYIEDTITPETDNCSLFGGYRVIGICENKLSLYCSNILDVYEFDELIIENNSRTRLIVDYCECREDIIAFKFANTNDKCECEHDRPNKVEANSESEPDNNENLDCIANININGDRKTFKFKNYDDMKEFCNLCEQVLGIG